MNSPFVFTYLRGKTLTPIKLAQASDQNGLAIVSNSNKRLISASDQLGALRMTLRLMMIECRPLACLAAAAS